MIVEKLSYGTAVDRWDDAMRDVERLEQELTYARRVERQALIELIHSVHMEACGERPPV